ncbi:MAG: hypothetical protein JWQ89_2975 [Devosia sp.]|uniref:hypothetical protein n=1 Tax=Devosia sp. TaxID=1871048 RepID=UPI00261467D7|nr:hypothetical protein [Devosia sp.]MDB5541248.1 hypothetical protein [Devosia sp.]
MSKAETIRSGKLGKLDLRLVRKDGQFFGLADGKVCLAGADADDVWRRLHDEAGKANPHYFGFAGARARFLKFFPNGFQSAGYTGDERDYKVALKNKLEAGAPLEQAATGSGFTEAVLSAYQTNMLSVFEKVRVRDTLRGPNGDDFVRAAARFALGEGKVALRGMQNALKPHDGAKWTIVTYLPFLWPPEEHLFLKPEKTKDFAERVGHRFANDYGPALDLNVYESLLDLASKTAIEIADLRPRDRIDVQS